MLEEVLLGGGSFWGLEAALSALNGVEEVWPGYAGGHMDYPNRELVATGITGHVEVVQVTYDPEVINFNMLLRAFFAAHDSSIENSGLHRTPGPRQYASVIFYSTKEQKVIARQKIAQRNEDEEIKLPTRTKLHPMASFWVAEARDIGYYFFNHHRDEYCKEVIKPRLNRFARDFWQYLKLPERALRNNPYGSR
ncbi:MAG TPA: peptide-methionine (S)-S-oxide reductase [Paenalcaligenes sp.]|nr:peptide-methionine (S)-S-oxide reductase [Paenalcaligenes sp.]